jgi:ribosomal protein L40E
MSGCSLICGNCGAVHSDNLVGTKCRKCGELLVW